jgi:FAD:protein FMN transferase
MQVEQEQIPLMGTLITLQVEAESPRPILEEMCRRLHLYEHRFSANDPASELGALNRAAGRYPVRVHPQLYELIALGVEHSLAPDSMLNVAIGPLVQLWRIGFSDARVPSPSEIEAALELTDPTRIELDERGSRVHLDRPGMKLDLGALAKGYVADLLLGHLQEQDVRSAMINLGGNVLTYGPSPHQADGRWRVGLRHPKHPGDQVIGSVSVEDRSVVTSGVYQRQLSKDGRTFHHLLDPRTGYPIESDVTSLTIVSRRSVDGEIWTSRLFGLDGPEILRTIDAQPETSAVVITDDLRLYASGALREQLVIGAARSPC